MKACPVCGSRQIGRINTTTFFCRDCYLEFNEKKQVFSIAEDGSLAQITGGELECNKKQIGTVGS